MSNPRLNGLMRMPPVNRPFSTQCLKFLQPSFKPDNVLPFYPPSSGKNDHAQKWNSLLRFKNPAFIFMQFQAQAFEKFHNLPFDKPQKPPVMVTNNKIIHVPQIMAALQFFFNEMVQ